MKECSTVDLDNSLDFCVIGSPIVIGPSMRGNRQSLVIDGDTFRISLDVTMSIGVNIVACCDSCHAGGLDDGMMLPGCLSLSNSVYRLDVIFKHVSYRLRLSGIASQAWEPSMGIDHGGSVFIFDMYR
jgi:hypothetical protein